ncbi:MAG: triple tyrosine motif-containing protein [Bacteroidetes bacterium]|nr:triple tyrosine motif-containing protein [Bacteroidota bacterium]
MPESRSLLVFLLTLLIVCIIQDLASAQDNHSQVKLSGDTIAFTHLTKADGLPSNRTRCVIQDFQGYVWIGTDNGLVRFDGHNATVFRHDRNDPSSVIDICINALYETRDSILLIGAIDGLSIYNPFTKEFTGYSIYSKGKAWFPVTSLTCFYEDSDRSIWIGTENGLVHMKRQPVGFSCCSLRKSEKKTDREYNFNFVTCIIQDPREKDKLLISTLGGLLQFDKVTNTITHDYKKINNNMADIIALNLDAGHYLWSCGWGIGLNCLDLETGKWQEYPYDAQTPISIVGITKRNRDEFWLATIDHGLGIFRKSDHSFRFYQKIPGDERSLLSNLLIKIKYLNNKKDLWILSDDGINIMDMRFQSFRDVAIPFKNNFIRSFFRDKETGHLYVGAIDCKGLFDWDEKNNRWSIIAPSGDPGGKGLSILTMYKDSRSVLWLGTVSGLWFLDPSIRKLRMFRTPGGNTLPLKDPHLSTIMEDERFNLWIGTRNEGVIRIDSTRSRITHYQHNPQDPSSIIDGSRISSICSDKFHNIWIGTDNGISIYDPVENRFRNDLMDSLLQFGVTKRWINGIVRDTLGRMWMIVDVAGLLRVDVSENRQFSFKLFNTSNALNNPSTGRMAMDARGGIWTINYGLFYINPYDESIHLFNEHNGLTRPMGLDESLYIDPDGNVYVGGKERFEAINIRDLDFTPLTIKLLLESLEINGKNVSLEKNSDPDHPRILSAGQNNLLFHYTGICFQDVEQMLFRYKMEGYDKDWIMAGTGREARYTNLPPGKYRFVFQVSNRSIWLAQESSMWLIIRPLFWKTWWFITMVILVTGFILFSIYRYRVRELLRLERLRTRIATDLHDDIGSTLSSISILSDILLQQVENPKSAKMLGTIGTNAHKMLEKIDDIIWVVNPTNDKFQNLGLRIREFAIPLFESKNIRHEIIFDKQMNTLQLPMEIRRNIYLIAKETINNAIKYSECKSVKILFRQQHHGFIMEISDDGKGFNPDVLTSRNGIKNMKLRTGQIHSQIDIKSALGEGTQITVRVNL